MFDWINLKSLRMGCPTRLDSFTHTISDTKCFHYKEQKEKVNRFLSSLQKKKEAIN